MSDPIEDELRRAILGLYAAAQGPLESKLVYERLREWDSKSVANRIFTLKQRGLLVSSDRGLNDITAKGRALLAELGGPPVDGKPADAGVAPLAAARTQAQVVRTKEPFGSSDTPPLPGPDAGLLGLLTRAARNAQDALDDYLAMIADPRILEPLRAARDQSRAALQAFEGRKD